MPPADQVHRMSGREFFTLGAALVREHGPHATDWSQVARRRLLGLEIGERFDWDRLAPDMRAALEEAPAAALATLRAKAQTLARNVNGWQMATESFGVYGDDYLRRAAVAMVGLGANQPVDAVYPLSLADADGRPYDGSARYVIRFAPDEMPPVGAFWSITLYDAEGFQVGNELDRYAIGDRDPLTYGEDGSLEIVVAHDRPGVDQVPNWLPAPAGPWNLCMRLYAPGRAVLDGSWAPPPVRRVD